MSSRSDPPRIDDRVLRAADVLLGLASTPAERAQLGPVAEQRRRDMAQLRALAPALAEAAVGPMAVPRGPPPLPAGNLPPLPGDAAGIALAAVWQQSAWLGQGGLTSAALTQIYLERIARCDPGLGAVARTAPDALSEAALSDARRRAGCPRSPLDGIPYLAKDLIDTAGLATERGSTLFAARLPDRDATVIARLREAGAVLLGKAACGELGYGDVTAQGMTRNPWNPAEGASGSSSGSAAAVAAGLCAFALGTDTLGSTIMPAERCGVVGLRPSPGRIDYAGTMPIAPSLDKIGLLVRDERDLSPLLTVLSPQASPATPAALDRPILGYVPAAFRGPLADQADRDALDAAGATCTLVALEWPALPFALLRSILEAEAAASFAGLLPEGGADALAWQGPMAWPNLWRLAWRGSAVDLVLLQRLRAQATAALDALLGSVDALLTPHHAGDALVATSFAGLPCVMMPCGTAVLPARDLFNRPLAGARAVRVPRGISLIGRRGEDTRLCALAAILAAPLPPRRPPPGFGADPIDRNHL